MLTLMSTINPAERERERELTKFWLVYLFYFFKFKIVIYNTISQTVC